MRVLVVEDEPKMAGLLRRGLTEEGYTVEVADDGDAALGWAVGTDFDVVALDVMLPGRSGLEVCRALRRRQVWVPILMLTARDGITDRVRGLDGADGVGAAMTIEVRDHGTGFDPDFLPWAFDWFTRTDPARTSGGTGLGLAITAALAARNHGQVRATNYPDGGAGVILILPAAPTSISAFP